MSAGSRSGASTTLTGRVVGAALYRARPADMAALRRRPGPIPDGWTRTPASLLRYSDEQTVVGTAAVFSALQSMDARPEPCERWGIVAASRYLGRASLASALQSFAVEGVWGTSPHLIPHFALHSPSGTISLALGLRGPNLGVGGGLHAAAEGFLAATTWLSAGVVPGVWLVISGWTPELVPGRKGDLPAADPAAAPQDLECHALALALRPGSRAPRDLAELRVVSGGKRAHADVPLDLVQLANMLTERDNASPRMIATDSAGRLRVELVRDADGTG